MKKLTCLITSILILFSFSACNSTNITDQKEYAAKEVLYSYFSEYEKSNYEGMKEYCTDEFIQSFFHASDVFGNISAKLLQFTDRKIDTGDENTLAFEIKVSTNPIKGSANYDENEPIYETYHVYILEKQSNGEWLIADLRLDM